LAVDSSRLAAVARWRGQDGVGALAEALRPPVREQLRVGERIEVDARVSDLGPEQVRLSAQVSMPGEPPRSVPLGTLREGARTYRADLPQCGVARCRLVGLM